MLYAIVTVQADHETIRKLKAEDPRVLDLPGFFDGTNGQVVMHVSGESDWDLKQQLEDLWRKVDPSGMTFQLGVFDIQRRTQQHGFRELVLGPEYEETSLPPFRPSTLTNDLASEPKTEEA